MSDLEKLFENAPEGATEIVAWGNNIRWANNAQMYSLGSEHWVERDSGWQTIATRQPEYPPLTQSLLDEAKSEPEWTHIIEGRKCKIVLNEPDVDEDIVVLRESGAYHFACYDQLKPIKPTITKAEKEKCAALAGYFNINPAEFDEYMSKYEVVEQLRKEQDDD